MMGETTEAQGMQAHTMFQRHRIEILTFAIALSAAAGVFLLMELRKPDKGFFSRFDTVAKIRHQDTGALLLTGRTRAQAVAHFANQCKKHRNTVNQASASSVHVAPGSEGLEEGAPPFDEHTLTGADLQEITLSNSDLAWLVVRKANLTGSDFRESLLTGGDFEGSNFAGANLSLATLNRANFSHASFRGTQFVGATAQDARFREADLTGANLFGADFRNADFSGANLAGVTVGTGTRLEGALLDDARNVPDAFRALAGPSDEPGHVQRPSN